MKLQLSEIRNKGLTIIEYLTLTRLYDKLNDLEDRFEGNLGKVYVTNSLQEKGFIKITDGKVDLRYKAILLFEGEKDLFIEFFNKFPIKTPSGRRLRPSSLDTIKGIEIRRKWNKHFNSKDHMYKKHIIKVLEAEMEWRRKTNKFEYMHNILTWLNQGDYELYEDLLEDNIKANQSDFRDF